MKTRLSGLIALMLALILVVSASGLAAERASEAFRLSGVTERPASEQADSGVAANGEQSVTPEAFGMAQGSADLAAPVKYRVNLASSLTVDVYAEASLRAQVIAQMYGGYEVDVVGYEGDWSKILLPDGAVGYVPSMYLTSAESIMDAAVEVGDAGADSEASDDNEASAETEVEAKPQVTKFPEPVKYRVNLDAGELANVYVEASETSRLIAQMYGGFEVDVTGAIGDWYQICLPNGMVGFTQGRYLTEAQAAAAPDVIVTEEPAPQEDANNMEETPAEPEIIEKAEDTPEPEVTPEPEATEEPEAAPDASSAVQYEVNVDEVNVRIGPSTDARIIARATQGYVVNVIGTEGDWSKILLPDGTTAYIKSEYLTKVAGQEPEAGSTEAPETEPTEEPEAEPTEEPEAEPTEEPDAEEPEAEPTEEVVEEPEVKEQTVVFEYERNEDGSLKLDENGDPILIDAEGLAMKPTSYMRDENGELLLDENGDPIPAEIEAVEPEQEEALAEGELNPNRAIVIYADLGGQEPHMGMEITLISKLSGYENVDYTLQWQTSPDGVNWTDVAGETGETCNVVITEQNCMDQWRVIAIIDDAQES